MSGQPTGFEVDFEPIGRRVSTTAGETILSAAQQAGVMLTSICGGEGVCGRCIVRVMAGQVSAPNLTEDAELGEEQVSAGWRLACQTEIEGDIRVHVPPESLVTAQRTQTEGETVVLELNPAVRAYPIELEPPNLADLRSDATRIRAGLRLPDLVFPTAILRRLSTDLRAQDFRASIVLRGAAVAAILPAHTLPLGLAVDIGTTKLAAYLVDLASGETLALAGAMNPQIAYGEDVMARIGHAIRHPDGAEQLRSAIVEALNTLAEGLCTQAGRRTSEIADAVIVGNTAMHHLFLGLPVRQLGLAPYVATESNALDLPSQEVGLVLAPGAYVHLLPNIAGFVGADHVAMLLASGMLEQDGIVLGMDIGTNTEISLVAAGKHYACSTASGPAFEGAHILHGMRAAPGAIEKVLIKDGQVLIQTVDQAPPVGLCGSGILDLVAQLRRAGIINPRGAFTDLEHNPRVRQGVHGPEFIVATASENGGAEITFSRSDVNEIQLAKGAMRAGVNILLRHAGIQENDIDEIIVAGAFGTYLDVQSGIDIGMFPRIDRGRYKQVGNAAGAGARMALLSMDQRRRAIQIARGVEYIELTAEPEFASTFARALLLMS
jgi:uncharacterized 2Fe-2S/4Fe-4S cluster protein (DUF4445 family)